MAASDTTASNAEQSGCEDVCSLPSDELRDRVAMVRRELLPHVKRREALANGVGLEFEHTLAMQKTLEDFVAFERECCSGLEWKLRRPSSRVLRLDVQGLAPDSDFFRVFGGAAEVPRLGRLARLAQAGALGSGVAFFLCCIVPVGIGAVAGTAVAASLAKLDDPLVIAAGSFVLAVPAWLWLKRRAEHSAEAGCTDGC